MDTGKCAACVGKPCAGVCPGNVLEVTVDDYIPEKDQVQLCRLQTSRSNRYALRQGLPGGGHEAFLVSCIKAGDVKDAFILLRATLCQDHPAWSL